MNIIPPPLKCSYLKHLWDLIGVFKTTNIFVREEITIEVIRNSLGPKIHLLKDKEAYIVEKS